MHNEFFRMLKKDHEEVMEILDSLNQQKGVPRGSVKSCSKSLEKSWCLI